MKELFKEARAEARRILNKKHPDLNLKVIWQGLGKEQKAIIRGQ